MNRTTVAIYQVRKGACPRIRRVIKTGGGKPLFLTERYSKGLFPEKLCSRAHAEVDARAPSVTRSTCDRERFSNRSLFF